MVLFRLPKWTVAAVAFNNTTSLPLLLVQSLRSTGALDSLLGSHSDEHDFDRVRSYFLVFAVVINVLTFGEGEKALTGYKDHGFPFAGLLGIRKYAVDIFENGTRKHRGRRRSGDQDVEDPNSLAGSEADESEGDEDGPTQTTPLLQRQITPIMPGRVTRGPVSLSHRISSVGSRVWSSFPRPLKSFLRAAKPFANSTSLGAAAGVIIGITPPLHRLFFNPMYEGGYFNAWLTTPLKNMGELFVTLQVIVVGVSLSLSIRQRKRDSTAGDVPRSALTFVLLMRFVIFPA